MRRRCLRAASGAHPAGDDQRQRNFLSRGGCDRFRLFGPHVVPVPRERGRPLRPPMTDTGRLRRSATPSGTTGESYRVAMLAAEASSRSTVSRCVDRRRGSVLHHGSPQARRECLKYVRVCYTGVRCGCRSAPAFILGFGVRLVCCSGESLRRGSGYGDLKSAGSCFVSGAAARRCVRRRVRGCCAVSRAQRVRRVSLSEHQLRSEAGYRLCQA